MAQVTGGKVAFRRTVQPADYESKSAEVEFSFTLAEGEDPKQVAAEAMVVAKDVVLRTLGLRKLRREQ